MDRPIERKFWNNRRIVVLIGIFALAALIMASYYFTKGGSRLNVEAERISIVEVKSAAFREFIPINGTVMPISSIFLDASVGGRVEEKFVEDGAQLLKGDAIMRLSNTDLELNLVQQETQVLNLLTQTQIAQTNAQQASVSNKNQMADVEQAFREAARIYTLNKKLYEERAIGAQEYQRSMNDYNYQKERVKLINQILQQDSVSTSQKLQQDQITYHRTQRALELMRGKVGDLIVRAPVDGQLTSFDAEIGQSKGAGERLGQIDVLTSYKVRAEIDEHYINRIYTEQEGEVVVAGKNYTLQITKVYTQVANGRFQVDMAFTDDVPEGIRRGQTLQIRLALSDETNALLLAKGGFYQQTGGNWVFKLDDNGKIAYRVPVQFGRQNPDYYEIIQGLEAGDRVVISSYQLYDKIQELHIKR